MPKLPNGERAFVDPAKLTGYVLNPAHDAGGNKAYVFLVSLGLTAANSGVLIPVQCEYLALEGLTQLLNTIGQVRDVLNPELRIWGVLLTMYDGRTNLGQQVVHEVQTHFANEVFKTIIPRNIRLSEAPSYGQSILSYAPGSNGALAYQALAQEVLERAEKAQPLRTKEAL